MIKHTRKARKSHVCDQCNKEIKAGETYIYTGYRVGEYDENDKQTGIFYFNFKECCKCVGENNEEATRIESEQNTMPDYVRDYYGI